MTVRDEKGFADPIARALDRGDTAEATAHFETLASLGETLDGTLLGLRARWLARLRDAKAAAAFREVLAWLEDHRGRFDVVVDPRVAVTTFETFDEALRNELASDFNAWLDKRKFDLPPEMRARVVVTRSVARDRTNGMLLEDATKALEAFSPDPAVSNPKDAWKARAQFEASLEALAKRKRSKKETAACDSLRAALARKLEGHAEMKRRRDLGEFELTATLETVEAIFRATIPPPLRDLWKASMNAAPEARHLQRGLRFWSISDGVSGLTSEASSLSFALDRSSLDSERLLALPFALRGVSEKHWTYALDLRSGPPYAVLEHFESSVDPDLAGLPRTVASSAKEWFEAGGLAWRDPKRKRKKLARPEPLSAKDKRRLEDLKRALQDRKAELRPGLSDEEVDDFERAHGVRLPAQYRAFVIEIGDGGHGPPAYGVPELMDSPALSEPFGLTRAVVSDRQGKGSSGRLYVGTDGCGTSFYLVVTGDARGEVWCREDGSFTPIGKPRRDFFGWYEGWIDGSLEEDLEG